MKHNCSYDSLPELKDIEPGTTFPGTVSNSGTLQLLNGVANGTDFTNRIGRKINMVDLEVKMFFFPISGNAYPGDVIRVMLIYDKQTNGALPAVSDILTSAYPLSFTNLNNRNRFEVLHDEAVALNPQATVGTTLGNGAPENKWREFRVKLRHDTIYGSTGANIADIKSGAIYMLTISAFAVWQIAWNARVRFYDE